MVSVVVPVYNAEEYLHDCVRSILNQTYSDLELLLIDDGSMDRSYEMCMAYANQDNRVLVFHQKHGGVSSARNNGIDHARGRFITFIDADDIVDREYISRLYAVLSSAADMNSSLAICGVQRELYTGRVIREAERYDHLKDCLGNPALIAPFIQDVLTGQFFCVNVRMLIPLSLIRDKRLKFERCRIHEDQLFFLDLVNCVSDIIICSEPLYFYRYVDGSGLTSDIRNGS